MLCKFTLLALAIGAVAQAPVSQISDGQIQATSAASVAISAASVATSAASVAYSVVSMTTSATSNTTGGAPVSQISDGQIQATATFTSQYTGAANANAPGAIGLVALGALAFL